MKRILSSQRILDILIATALSVLLFPVLIFIAIGCKIDIGRAIYTQVRVGARGRVFKIYKFPTMPIGTPIVPTHELSPTPLTWFGIFLRKSKLDELPQLMNVLLGDMSLVGPRPCLPIQTELIRQRMETGVLELKPGLTGLAQISGVDMSDLQKLRVFENKLLKCNYLRIYFYCLCLTVLPVSIRKRMTRNGVGIS